MEVPSVLKVPLHNFLNRNIETAKDIIATHDVDCLELVSRLICSYYLPLCGNATHLQSPSSICKEEFSHVQETCSATWQAVILAFDDLDPFLDCEDTSRIIFPLPSCCNGAGIVLQQSPTGEHYVMLLAFNGYTIPPPPPRLQHNNSACICSEHSRTVMLTRQ